MPDWPGFVPGDRGVLNTMAPVHFRITSLAALSPKPPILWLRGTDDVIVSDTSLYDLAYLGSIGAVPGWPGPDAWPPQPMLGQTRALLDGYAAAGGQYRETAIQDSGHGPHLDQPAGSVPRWRSTWRRRSPPERSPRPGVAGGSPADAALRATS